MENGHYASYILQQMQHGTNEWIKCDDESLSRASVEEVLGNEAYLLFYSKRFFEYKTSQ